MKPRSNPTRLLRFALAAWLVLSLSAPGPLLANPGNLDNAVRAAQQAGMPAETVNRLLAMGYEQKVDPEQVIALLELLSAVRKDGLPTAPFLNKVEEGLTKRVPPPVILQVLRERRDDYTFARDLLGAKLRQ